MATPPEQVSLRPLEEQDLELVLAWRNDREVMRYLPSATFPLRWTNHWEWFHDPARPGLRRDWMVVLENPTSRPRRVGVTHCVLSTGEVGLVIGEKALWRQGVGRAAMEQTLRAITTPYWEVHRDQFGPIWAVVHPENTASRRLFRSLNFVEIGTGRNAQIKYIWQGWNK